MSHWKTTLKWDQVIHNTSTKLNKYAVTVWTRLNAGCRSVGFGSHVRYRNRAVNSCVFNDPSNARSVVQIDTQCCYTLSGLLGIAHSKGSNLPSTDDQHGWEERERTKEIMKTGRVTNKNEQKQSSKGCKKIGRAQKEEGRKEQNRGWKKDKKGQ